MKTFLILVVLLFSSLVYAEDISDFEIEGFGIGDSLLKFFTIEEINSHEQDYYNDDEYIPVYFTNIIKLEKFEGIQFHYKYNDNKFMIVAIEAALLFKNQPKQCEKKMKEIELEIENIFKNIEKDETGITPHQQDPSGKSTFSANYYYLKNGHVVLGCVNWDINMKEKYNLIDNLRLGIYTSDFQNWIDNIAYK
tara:strand:- start:544 stop:1125 length:582 start_codon:yes stop_codon:yes gene_type:complete